LQAWAQHSLRQHQRSQIFHCLRQARARVLLCAAFAALQWHMQRQQRRRLALARALRARAQRCLYAWRTQVLRAAMLRTRLAFLCVRRQRRSKGRALQAWRAFAQRRSSNAAKMEICTSRAALKTLTSCWRHWRWLGHSLALLNRVFSHAEVAWAEAREVHTSPCVPHLRASAMHCGADV